MFLSSIHKLSINFTLDNGFSFKESDMKRIKKLVQFNSMYKPDLRAFSSVSQIGH